MICYLVRHGKDDETVRGGWSQHSLTDEGIQQANMLGDYIAGNLDALAVKHIFTSDLPRAMQTAQIIGNKLDLPVIACPQFREVNNGELAGMKNELALVRYPGLFWNQLGWEQCYPGGESPRQFYERIASAWELFSEKIRTGNGNVLLVTHGGVIHVILSMIAGRMYTNTALHRHIQHAEMIAVAFDGKHWKEVEF